MTNPSLQTIPAVTRTSVIRIYRYDNSNPQGTLYNRHYEQEQTFENLMQLLELLNTTAVSSRTAVETPVVCWNHSKNSGTPLASFKLQLLFCEHYEWQGYLCWIEGKQTRAFRSALELIKLMDDVLAPEAETQYGMCEAVDAG